MKAQSNGICEFRIFGGKHWTLISLVNIFVVLLLFSTAHAAPLSISVTGSDGTNPPVNVTNFRWLVEEDQTYNTVPGVNCFSPNYADCQALNFHKSYMPVIAEGHSTDNPFPTLDPTKRYYISVLPDAGYTIGGTQLAVNETAASITVGPVDVPTAQIRVFVFNDTAPINGVPDGVTETGIDGMKIIVEDAGGRYGISGQHIVNDVYGNPLGTTYSSQGVVDVMGDGTITTGADGFVTIQNLAPAKYGIQAVPSTGSGYVQTSTIEGKKIVDAWVKPNEPPFFQEFGPARPPGPHVFIGFVKQIDDLPAAGGAQISGTITSLHNSRPPEFTFHSGAPVGGCWVGLNETIGGAASGDALFAAPCDGNSNFTISNVPEGTYQLVIWDEALDYIISYKAITVSATDTNIALGEVPIFAWFARLEQKVFNDVDGNGIWDAGEVPMPEQGTAIRWRDGTMYQSFPTDLGGEAPYDEVFPFFHWLVAEVAFDRFEATGVTVRVDGGGAVAPGEVLNPQPQSLSDGAPFEGAPYRVETGPVLTQAFQGFSGQTSVIEWGKRPYAAGKNGGISGIVYYATTRAEDDPRYAGAEPWEPGIPRIQVALYQDSDGDGVIDDLDTPPNGVQLADVDNAPFGNFPSAEDYDYNSNGTNDAGDAIQVGTTDSWDDNVPTGCQGDVFLADGVHPTDCFDGLRNFNQVRPGVFDGGYAFDSYFPGGVDSGSTEVDGLPSGTYIVASGDHKAYKTLKEQDRNVDFGDNFVIPDLLPPVCVGDDNLVTPVFSLFDSGEAPTSAGLLKPRCDRKQVLLTGGKNAAADFYMFTYVPPSGHLTGVILNDVANEFDPTAPAFGEKFAPPNLPVSFRDYLGNEVSRTYSDRWGMYNALVPSTFTNSLPSSSGISPSMLTSCMNDPGPINVGGQMVIDPAFKREYTQFCYTWQYMPGATTYLDTPILPIAAFTTAGQFPLDCEYPDGTPVIWSTQGPNLTGPYVGVAGDNLTLVSAGNVDVRNPDFDGTNAETISRDFGFGNTVGTVRIDGVLVPVPQADWTNDLITLAVPAGGGQLEIQRSNGLSTHTGIHVTVGGLVTPVTPGTSIQTAIDLADPGSTVIIPPGTYNETLVMWKPIRLQGSGASTVINAASSAGTGVVEGWRAKVEALVTNGSIDLLPPQGTTWTPETLLTEQAAGIIVLAKDNPTTGFAGKEARIDGITIMGSNIGGGIVVNGYAHDLEISNNRILGNSGVYGGGIRVGHSIFSEDSINTNLNIHNNYIAENGGFVGAGAGISLYSGSDNYNVASNYVCGNFSVGDGAGIAHQGMSLGGLANSNQITGNTILFNQSFNQGTSVAGGGISIAGVLEGGGGLTQGSGPVDIKDNHIQGNNAGAGNGGGISLAQIDGAGAAIPYPIVITGNTIVNNVAGLAGGGISLQDAVSVDISNNTIAHNDSTATSGEAFCDTTTGTVCDANQSTPRAAGIASYAHSLSLAGVIGAGFSNPTLNSNVIWENRSFYFFINNATSPSSTVLIPDVASGATQVFDDLAVYPASAGALNPMNGTLTNINEDAPITVYDASNTSADPNFTLDYFNGSIGTGIQQVEFTTISTPTVQVAFDEGGNFIDVRYGPLSPVGDYTVLQTPPTVVLISPIGNGAASTSTFTFTPVSATDYRLLVVDSVGTHMIDVTETTGMACGPGTPTSCSISTTQLGNGTYWWSIQAKNALGWGPWSTFVQFSVGSGTVPDSPMLGSPIGDIGVIPTPTYNWTAVNATDYRLLVVDNSGTHMVDVTETATMACGTVNPSSCSLTPSSVLVTGDYWWSIQAKNALGWGSWSTFVKFTIGSGTVPDAPLLGSPTGTVAANPSNYNWTAVNANDYRLMVVDSSGTRVIDVTETATIACGTVTPTSCSITPGTSLLAGTYWWSIQAKNTFGWGSWSTFKSFQFP